jgi:hypothetical protein
MSKLRWVPVVLLLTVSTPALPLDALAGRLWSWIVSEVAEAGCGMDPNGVNCG